MSTLEHLKARKKTKDALEVMAKDFIKPFIDARVEMTKKDLTQMIEERLLEGKFFGENTVKIQKGFSLRRWIFGYEDGRISCATVGGFWIEFFLEKNVIFLIIHSSYYDSGLDY